MELTKSTVNCAKFAQFTHHKNHVKFAQFVPISQGSLPPVLKLSKFTTFAHFSKFRAYYSVGN